MAEQWNDDVEKRLRESVDGYREGDTVDDQLLPCADVAAALAELDRRGAEIERLRGERDRARRIGLESLQDMQEGLARLSADMDKLRAPPFAFDTPSRGSAPAAEQLGQMDEYGLAAVALAEADHKCRASLKDGGPCDAYHELCDKRDVARERFEAAQAARAGFLCSRCGKATDSTRQTDDSDRPVCAACAQAARGKATIPLNQQDAPPAAQEPRWMGDAQLSSWGTCSRCGAVHFGWSKLAHERSCWRVPAPRAEASEMVRIAHALLGCESSPSEGVPCPVEHGHFTVETLLNSIKELQRCERELIDYQNALDPECTIVNETTGISYYDILKDALAAQRRAPPPAGEIAPEERAMLDAFKDLFVERWFTGNFNTPKFRRAGSALSNWLAWAKRRAGEGAK